MQYHGQTGASPLAHIFSPTSDPNQERNSDILGIHGTVWFQRPNNIYVNVQRH